jgi:hypothetical protein
MGAVNMKTTRYFPVILLAAAALILSCEQPIEDLAEPKVETLSSGTGFAVVSASVAVDSGAPAEAGDDPVEAVGGGGGIPPETPI